MKSQISSTYDIAYNIWFFSQAISKEQQKSDNMKELTAKLQNDLRKEIQLCELDHQKVI